MPVPGSPAPEQGGESPGGASQLVADINQKLTGLMDLVDGSQVADDDDRAKLATVIQGFQAFVDGLGNPPQGAKPPAQGVVPAEAGAAPVKPAM